MIIFQGSNLLGTQALGLAIGACHISRFAEVLAHDPSTFFIQHGKAAVDAITAQHLTVNGEVIPFVGHQLTAIRRCIPFSQLCISNH